MALRFLICSITGLLFFAQNIDGSKKQDFFSPEQSYSSRPQQIRLNADIVSLASQILEPFLVNSPDSSLALKNLPRQPVHLSFKDDDVSANPTKHSSNRQIQRDLVYSRNQQTSPKSGNRNHRQQRPQSQSSIHQPYSESHKTGFHLETVPLHQFYQNFSKDFPASHWSYEQRNHSSGNRKYHGPEDFSAFVATGDTRTRETLGVHSSQDTTIFQNAKPQPSRHSSRFRPIQSGFDTTHSSEKLISVSRQLPPSNQNFKQNVERTPRTSHIRVQNEHERKPSPPYYTANSHIRSNVAVHPDSTRDAKFVSVPFRETHDSKSLQHYNVYPDDKDSGRRFLVFRAPTLITTSRPSSAPFSVDTREKKLQRKPALPSFEEASHEDFFNSKEKFQPTAPTVVVQRPNTPSIVIDVVTLHNVPDDKVEKAIKDLGIEPHSNTKYDDFVFGGTTETPHVEAKYNNHNYPSKQFEDLSHFNYETTVKQMPPPSSFTPQYSPEFSQNILPESTTPLPPLTAAFGHDRHQNHHQLESNPYGRISPFSNTVTSTKRPKVKAKPKPVSARTSEKRKSQSTSFLPESGSFGSQNVPGQPGSDYPIFNEIPFTNFDCKEFQKPGFYADIEAGCQVFHNCDMGMKKHSFVCPNGTIFHQQLFICDWWYNVRCDDSPDFFNLNEGLYIETSTSEEKQQKSENHKRNNKRVAS